MFLIGALYGAGIRHFDVASLPEIEDAATIPDAHLHFMHPVKSRHAIRRAYSFGVRSFALDGEDELDKILEATDPAARPAAVGAHRGAGDQQPHPARAQVRHHRARRQRGCSLRRGRPRVGLGLTFHVGSQTMTPDAYVTALGEVHKLIVQGRRRHRPA